MPLASTICIYSCCSSRNALTLLLTSSTTFLVVSLAFVQPDKHSRSYASISLISRLDSLWMFSSAVSRAMSTLWRKESQCSRMIHSDLLSVLVSSAVESPICARRDLNFASELDIAIYKNNKQAKKHVVFLESYVFTQDLLLLTPMLTTFLLFLIVKLILIFY